MDGADIRYQDSVALIAAIAHRPLFLLLLLAVTGGTPLALSWLYGRHIDRSGGPR